MVETLITAMLKDRYDIGLKFRPSLEYRKKWEAYYKSLESGKNGHFYRTRPLVILPLNIIGYSALTNHERFLIHSAWRFRSKNTF